MARGRLSMVVAVLLGVGGFMLASCSHVTDGVSPTDSAAVTSSPGPMAPPTHSSSPATPIALAEGSDQETRGAQVYTQRCITCHGDRGQGLTLEWRLTWDPAHQNCGQPNCHGLNHPPEGFYLPNMYAPAIVGKDTLDRFQTGQDVFDFISTRMPFQVPGTLPREDYWALTAFLLRQNGITPPGAEVGESNASRILLRPRPVQPTAPTTPGAQ